MQISQMFIGLLVNMWTLQQKQVGTCAQLLSRDSAYFVRQFLCLAFYQVILHTVHTLNLSHHRPYTLIQNGLPCLVSDDNIKASLVMYGSYFVLFCKFFYDSYVAKRNAKFASASSGENHRVMRVSKL